MQLDEAGAKVPNVKLREGQDPITVSGYANGGDDIKIAFPTEERQKSGWQTPCPKLIVRCYGDRYEMLNGGCNC